MPNASPVLHRVHLPCATLHTLWVAPVKIAFLTLLMGAYVVLLHAATRAIAGIKKLKSQSRDVIFTPEPLNIEKVKRRHWAGRGMSQVHVSKKAVLLSF